MNITCTKIKLIEIKCVARLTLPTVQNKASKFNLSMVLCGLKITHYTVPVLHYQHTTAIKYLRIHNNNKFAYVPCVTRGGTEMVVDIDVSAGGLCDPTVEDVGGRSDCVCFSFCCCCCC